MSFGWPASMQGGFGRQPWMASRAAQEGLAYGPGGTPPPPAPMNPALQPGMMEGPGNPGMQGGRPPMPPGVVESSQALHPAMPPSQAGAPAPGGAPGQGGMGPGMMGLGLLGMQLMNRGRGGQGGGLLDSVGGLPGLLAMQQMMRPGMFSAPQPAPGQPPMGPNGMKAGPV